MNPTREVSGDGYEMQLATNYLGHWLLFWLLRGTMLKSAKESPGFASRLVNVSSSGHHGGATKLEDINLEGEGVYKGNVGYGNSKTAQIWMANEVERKYGGKGLHAWSLMPGGIATGLQVHWSEEQRKAMATDPNMLPFMKSPEQGAATTVLAAVSKELEGKGGRYLENCAEAEPTPGPEMHGKMGYKEWAYDEEREGLLWKKTIAMLGLKDDGN